MPAPAVPSEVARTVVRASAGIVALVAGSGALGWLTGSPAILTYGAGLPWMVPSTIVCLLLTAAALVEETRGGSVRRSLLLLAPVVLVAGFHLFEVATGRFVNIDARLFGELAARIGPPDRPVRMADVTAASLVGLIIAHLLRRTTGGAAWVPFVAGALVVTVITLCTGAGIGYATTLLRPFQTGLVDYVAFPTAVALVALGVGELLLLVRARPEGWLASWIPSALVVALLVLTAQISLAAETYSRAERDRRVGQQAVLLAREAEQSYTSVVRSLQRMAGRWNTAGGTPPAVWLDDAARYVADHTGVRGLAVRGLPGATLAYGAGPTLGDTLTTLVAPLRDVAGRRGELVMLVDLRARLAEQLAAASAGYRVSVAPLASGASVPRGSAVAQLGAGRWQVTVTELARVDRSPFAVLLAAIGAVVAVLVAGAAQLGRLALQRGASVAAQAESLRASEQRLALALEGTELGLWDWHLPTGAVYFSERWCRMLGYEPDEIRPHVDSWAELVHPDDMAAVMAAVQAHLRGETPSYETEHRVRTKAGGWCWILDRGKVMERAADGSPLRMAGTHADVTARRAAGALLEQRTAELARSNEELQHFAYVASHDLQEPLRTVRAIAGLLRERYRDRLDAEGEQMLGFLEDGARRMRELVQGLLEYSRAGAAPVRDPVDLRAVVAHAEANLATLLAETGGRITVGPLPVVEGDARRLEQLVQNLLANALKFRGAAPPVVRITEEPSERPDFHCFVVADNGIGIAPQHAARVFQLFQRLHTQEEYRGSGIGLAVCQRIVQAHGGTIDAVPGAAGGTEIRFTLPRRTTA